MHFNPEHAKSKVSYLQCCCSVDKEEMEDKNNQFDYNVQEQIKTQKCEKWTQDIFWPSYDPTESENAVWFIDKNQDRSVLLGIFYWVK